MAKKKAVDDVVEPVEEFVATEEQPVFVVRVSANGFPFKTLYGRAKDTDDARAKALAKAVELGAVDPVAETTGLVEGLDF